MLGQRRRRWADNVQMLYKCFLFAGMQTDMEFLDDSPDDAAITDC